MAEDGKPTQSSEAQSPEKKPPTPLPPAPQPAQQKPPVAVPPRPVTPPPPRPAATPPPQSSAPKDPGRRTFVKVGLTVGAILSMIPFVPWGSFLSSSLTGGKGYLRQKVVVDNLSVFGPAAGKSVNVNDTTAFPPGTGWLITYPTSGDLTLDTNNKDTFLKYQLIRLPSSLGGDSKDATAFVALSEVCVHLWCSPQYQRAADVEHAYQCPCHGSQYEIPDGKATLGPASIQPAPTNAIPMLTLFADANGTLWIEAPIWDIDHNGVLGYGRNVSSYQNYIKGYVPKSGSS